MSSDIFFLAEYAEGTPSRSAIELATGAADLAAQSGGAAVALAYGAGAGDTAGLGTYGAQRAIVLGEEERPAITYAASAVAAVRGAQPLAILAPATPNGRDLAAALVGSLDLPAFGPVRSIEAADGHVRSEQATLQGSMITTSEPAEGRRAPPSCSFCRARSVPRSATERQRSSSRRRPRMARSPRSRWSSVTRPRLESRTSRKRA